MNIQEILDKENLTAYVASQLIGAETKEALKTIHARLSRWKKKDPLEVIRRDLKILGYEIKVEKIS